MLKKPKKMKLNSRQVKQDVLTAYRRITWKIWVYLKANPDVLAENNNQEVHEDFIEDALKRKRDRQRHQVEPEYIE